MERGGGEGEGLTRGGDCVLGGQHVSVFMKNTLHHEISICVWSGQQPGSGGPPHLSWLSRICPDPKWHISRLHACLCNFLGRFKGPSHLMRSA